MFYCKCHPLLSFIFTINGVIIQTIKATTHTQNSKPHIDSSICYSIKVGNKECGIFPCILSLPHQIQYTFQLVFKLSWGQTERIRRCHRAVHVFAFFQKTGSICGNLAEQKRLHFPGLYVPSSTTTHIQHSDHVVTFSKTVMKCCLQNFNKIQIKCYLMIGMDTFQKRKNRTSTSEHFSSTGEGKIGLFLGMKAHGKDALRGHLSTLDRKLK